MNTWTPEQRAAYFHAAPGSPPVPVMAGWQRSWPMDPVSGIFDYRADSYDFGGDNGDVGPLFTLDTDPDWVAYWGYPVPVVAEAGLYLLHLGATSSDPWRMSLDITGGLVDGNTFAQDASSWLAVSGELFQGDYVGSATLTVPLPVGTHLSVSSWFAASPPSLLAALNAMKIG